MSRAFTLEPRMLSADLADERLAARFWSKVDKRGPDECWLWTACTDDDGYGRLISPGGRPPRNIRANRLAYELSVGPIPAGLKVLHSCDNPPCCNPAHLSVGTNAQNTAERNAKGRQAAGERHACAKLTASQVEEIRAAEGGQREIGARFGISHTHVGRIKRGQNWRPPQ